MNWTNLRALNSSQNNAFEELVCQLARAEEIAHRVSFTKIGNPDGGVECYCALENGDEYGWQAKYFFSLSKTQWAEITKSFRTALRTHPKLKKYYICIPLDRADPRLPDTRHFMDKWNDKVKQWQEYALQQERVIEFEYWGSSELIDRLSQEKHAGRQYYWFGKQEFSTSWFHNLLNVTIRNLGERYTPELNFDLEIAKNFDAIALNDDYARLVTEKFKLVLDHFDPASGFLKKTNFTSAQTNILRKAYSDFQASPLKQLNIDIARRAVDAMERRVKACERIVRKKAANDEERRSCLNHLYKLSDAAASFKSFVLSRYIQLAHIPAMIIVGDAGIGKSHLLADIALKRSDAGRKTILVLGQHFNEELPPWTQLLKNLLHLECSKEEFLGALSAKAEASGERLLIFIDAINEGKGKQFWPDHISGFIQDFSAYPWLGLILSVRTTYEEELVPDRLVSKHAAIRQYHTGFRNLEYEAVKKFFTHYQINLPSTPLLNPEFQNPLFLKLFCEGLKRSGLHTIPKGYDGITNIINFYFKAINTSLARSAKFEYSKTIDLVEKSVLALIQKTIELDQDYVDEEGAYHTVQAIVAPFTAKPGFLDAMISEGVLTKNMFYAGNGKWREGIYLAYERFADHFKARFLFEKYLDMENPASAFAPGSHIAERIFGHQHWKNQGIIESLSIQLPEKRRLELYELLPDEKKHEDYVKSAFIESLLWREPASITDKVLSYINEAILPDADAHDRFFEVVLTQAGNPDHFFNARWLHRHLSEYSLAERDAYWTSYINHKLDEGTAIKRLIEWAWAGHGKADISEEAAHLTGIALAWLLTSTNGELRDSATKALVSLYGDKLKWVTRLLKAFEGINDPYVYERLYAAAYGCALRSADHTGLRELAEYTYGAVFAPEKIYPHVLLRDYARGIVEYAVFKAVGADVEIGKARPPYRSDFPETLPSNDEIDALEYDYDSPGFQDKYWAQNAILRSMTTEYGKGIGGYGDFGRYTFQSALSDWKKELDPQLLSNYAVKRIMEMGYNVDLHGEYDRERSSYDRNPSQIERIGKKYQWIAFHEILAKVADHYKMQDAKAWREEKLVDFQGPWEPLVRDIDPSILLTKTVGGRDLDLALDESNGSAQDWLNSSESLPDAQGLIESADSEGTQWLALALMQKWKEPVHMGSKALRTPQRQLWYSIRSYLVKDEQLAGIQKALWAKQSLSMDDHPGGERDMHKVFSREYYWSPAYNFFNHPYYEGEEWQELYGKPSKPIGSFLRTTERYLWERGQDKSVPDSIIFRRPHRFLYAGLGMRFSPEEGEFIDGLGKKICYDPSLKNDGPNSLLVRRDAMAEFLGENKLSLLWTVIGEKTRLDTYARGMEVAGMYCLTDNKFTKKIRTLPPVPEERPSETPLA